MTAHSANSTKTGAPKTRGGLHRKVVDHLAMQIIGGEFVAGQSLPVEADLCEAMGVGRSSVREAMRVLADKGMVDVRPRTGARVLDRASWRRLDPDLIGWMLKAGADREFLADLVEARRIVEPAAAALAAQRATGADLARIDAALDAMRRAMPESGNTLDVIAAVEADVAFHKAVLTASGNSVLEEFEIIIDAALRAAFRLSAEMSRSFAPTISAHVRVYESIRMRDAVEAQSAMSDLLNMAAKDLGLDPGR